LMLFCSLMTFLGAHDEERHQINLFRSKAMQSTSRGQWCKEKDKTR
jgi:hypothetical protein